MNQADTAWMLISTALVLLHGEEAYVHAEGSSGRLV
jgi:hypothetical protein